MLNVQDLSQSNLSAGIDIAATVWDVVDASQFPDPATLHYWVRVWNSSRYSDPMSDPDTEECRVTARDTGLDKLTVAGRGQDGETAAAHNESGQTYTVAVMAGKRNFGYHNGVAAVTSVGALANKIEVFDKDGTSLGWLPVYATIT